ncbi:MAG TPA: ABC transporter permease subunit [Planctomycetaceae bacterium]|nr:ABC transporter permease subunit [Planctomycetaceae bacterium]
MFAGPLLVREALVTPRQVKHFLLRAGYLGALFVLMYTAAQVTFGWQQVRNLADFARFGELVFQVFTLTQITLVMFFSVLFAAGNVAQEKDRRTLLLLLMTDLRDAELVLGKLLASLLLPLLLVGISYPVFVLVSWLGGVSQTQIACVLAISFTVSVACGAWGTLVAFWREKTFQTLAIALIGVVLWLAVVEAILWLTSASWAAPLNPFRAVLTVLNPLNMPQFATATMWSVLDLGLLAIGLLLATVIQLRIWNPSRTLTESRTEAEGESERTRNARAVWENPVIWREMMTRAYGRKTVFIKLAYLAVSAALAYVVADVPANAPLVLGMVPPAGFAFIAIGLLALLLVNTQAVTALTSERDANTLELLLVTELSAKEFVYGKLGGILFNTLEVTVAPVLFLLWQAAMGRISAENATYLFIGFAVLTLFAAMLGLHFGLTYGSSRAAIANSLATMFFLFVGIFLCMLLIVQARSSFAVQLPSFLVFILGGSLGLWAMLTHRNPSPALSLASAVLPFCTFYAITSFLLGQTLGVCLFISVAYGFTAYAMLVPAVSEFDVALGRSTLDQG